MKRWPLRVRLTALYGGLFLLAGILLLGMIYFLVQNRLDSQIDRTQDARTTELRQQAAAEADPIQLSDGRVLSVEDLIKEAQQQQEDFKAAALNSLLTQGGLALLGVGVLAIAAGWVIAGRALRPLHQIANTAQRIASSQSVGKDLRARIALDGKNDEVKRLADTFDSMLENLDRSFDGQHRFVANASHELRTPLALNRAIVELAITRPDASSETMQLGESLLAINERHEQLIDGLLTLADSENAITNPSYVDLADVADTVVHIASSDAEKSGIAIHKKIHRAPTLGDPILLERLAQNLIENAIRHNHDNGWVQVTTETKAQNVVLTIANSGPAVPAYEVEALFQPFRRLGDRRSGPNRGFGLGLSIVRAIAHAHGGQATATANPDGGLTVTITLPLEEAGSTNVKAAT